MKRAGSTEDDSRFSMSILFFFFLVFEIGQAVPDKNTFVAGPDDRSSCGFQLCVNTIALTLWPDSGWVPGEQLCFLKVSNIYPENQP